MLSARTKNKKKKKNLKPYQAYRNIIYLIMEISVMENKSRKQYWKVLIGLWLPKLH